MWLRHFQFCALSNFAPRIFFAQVLKFILVNFYWYFLLFYGNETVLKLNECFQGFLWMSTFTECVINYTYFCCCLKKLVTFRPNMQALRSRFALGSTPRAPQFPERLKGGRLEKWKVGIDCCDLWVQFNCLRDVWLVKNRPSFYRVVFLAADCWCFDCNILKYLKDDLCLRLVSPSMHSVHSCST